MKSLEEASFPWNRASATASVRGGCILILCFLTQIMTVKNVFCAISLSKRLLPVMDDWKRTT
jgi:hypothetical protein